MDRLACSISFSGTITLPLTIDGVSRSSRGTRECRISSVLWGRFTMSRAHLPVNSGFVRSCMASATPIIRSSKILDIGAGALG